MREILALAIAGAAGTLGRWAVGVWAARVLGDRFPYGTLLVNVLGCLLLGVAMKVVLLGNLLPDAWRLPITVGFLGAFTTFSTFGYQTMAYVEEGAWGPAAVNVAANLVLGLAATWLGFAVARAALGAS